MTKIIYLLQPNINTTTACSSSQAVKRVLRSLDVSASSTTRGTNFSANTETTLTYRFWWLLFSQMWHHAAWHKSNKFTKISANCGGDSFIQHTDTYPSDYMVSHPRRQYSQSPLWEPHISHQRFHTIVPA